MPRALQNIGSRRCTKYRELNPAAIRDIRILLSCFPPRGFTRLLKRNPRTGGKLLFEEEPLAKRVKGRSCGNCVLFPCAIPSVSIIYS